MASSHIVMVLLAAAALVLACGCINRGPVEETITASGKVTYVDLEGGFTGSSQMTVPATSPRTFQRTSHRTDSR